jgi:hypothetical protein
MAPVKLLLVGGLVAAAGCSGGNLPSGSIGPVDAHVASDADVDLPFAIDTSAADTVHADVAPESSCPAGMNCGMAPRALMRVDETCTFLIRCFVEGDFSRFGVVVDGLEIPRSQSEGWTYTDASMTAIELHGQVCSDLMSGAATTVELHLYCPPP